MRTLPGLATILFAAALATGAAAQDVKTLGTHGKWAAFSFLENGKQVCYIASQPAKSEGNYSKRGDILMQITHRPGDKATNVVSVVAGYPYKPDSDVGIQVGGSKWNLFTVEDRAWARDMDTDKAIVNAFIKGNNAVVTGTSSRGTLTTDTYSLMGFTAAYREIGKACGVS